MGFIRALSGLQINKMTEGENKKLFGLLKADVSKGEVFPAVRKNELFFYYKGGCLYKFSGGSFKRDKNYEKIEIGQQGLSEYETAKRQTEIRFLRRCGEITERQLLDGLYSSTFNPAYAGDTAVLDIEVDLNGTVGRGKKCDAVLLNSRTNEIMFVEGKVFPDRRVNVSPPHIPEVIAQVNAYTAAIAEQRQVILQQYAKHIEIVNKLFGASYQAPQKLFGKAKLLVYGKPKILTKNGEYTVNIINAELGENNVLWVEEGGRPSPDLIWSALSI